MLNGMKGLLTLGKDLTQVANVPICEKEVRKSFTQRRKPSKTESWGMFQASRRPWQPRPQGSGFKNQRYKKGVVESPSLAKERQGWAWVRGVPAWRLREAIA